MIAPHLSRMGLAAIAMVTGTSLLASEAQADHPYYRSGCNSGAVVAGGGYGYYPGAYADYGYGSPVANVGCYSAYPRYGYARPACRPRYYGYGGGYGYGNGHGYGRGHRHGYVNHYNRPYPNRGYYNYPKHYGQYKRDSYGFGFHYGQGPSGNHGGVGFYYSH